MKTLMRLQTGELVIEEIKLNEVRCQGDSGRCQALPGWPHTEACKAEDERILNSEDFINLTVGI